ncbi:MAG: hypothetical protein HYX48_05435 [Chlamydiales bacterium]|nr:hypothetical protein [Chlamydiales bacterium]
MTTPKKRKEPNNPKEPRSSSLTQQIGDLEHKFSIDIGSLLVLMVEGSQEQVTLANQKAKRDLIKFGPEMQKLAEQAGGSFPEVVEEYLNSVDAVVHSASGWIDEAKISHCYNMTQKLKQELDSYNK